MFNSEALLFVADSKPKWRTLYDRVRRGSPLSCSGDPPVGKGLMKALEAELMARGARRLRLEVRESNMVARRLYEGLGYRVVARLPKYYGDEDGLLMVKEL